MVSCIHFLSEETRVKSPGELGDVEQCAMEDTPIRTVALSTVATNGPENSL